MNNIKYIMAMTILSFSTALYAADAGETQISSEFNTPVEPLLTQNIKSVQGVTFECRMLGKQECDYAVAKALTSINTIKLYNIERVFLDSVEGWGPFIFGYQVLSLNYTSNIEEQLQYVFENLEPEDQIYINERLKEIELLTGLKAVCSSYPAINCRKKADKFLDLSARDLLQRSDITNKRVIYL